MNDSRRVTVVEIIQKIADRFRHVDTISQYMPDVPQTQRLETMGESIADLPTLQIYPESGATQSGKGTERVSFGGQVKISDLVVNVDFYARQRSHIGEDMMALALGIDAIYEVLNEVSKSKPLFGLEGIKAFDWTWQRVEFVYGDAALTYAGARFILNFTIF